MYLYPESSSIDAFGLSLTGDIPIYLPENERRMDVGESHIKTWRNQVKKNQKETLFTGFEEYYCMFE